MTLVHEQATVTAIIPTYNRAGYVGQAIDSALSQVPPPSEVIVVDDCSTDQTSAVLERYGSAIRVLRRSRRTERGAARNWAASEATGDYLAFLDSDDVWLPGKLATQLATSLGGSPSVHAMVMLDADGAPTGGMIKPSPRLNEEITWHNDAGPSSSLLVPRDIFLGVAGFPEESAVQGSEDWLLLVKLVTAGHMIVAVPEALGGYRVHSGSSTAELGSVTRSMKAAVQWMVEGGYVTPAQARRSRGEVITTLARMHARRGQWRGAVQCLRRAQAEVGSRWVMKAAAWSLASMAKFGAECFRARVRVQRETGSGATDEWRDKTVLLISGGFGGIGGIGQRTRLIAEGLCESGARAVVLVADNEARRFSWNRSAGPVVIVIPGFGKRWLGSIVFAIVGTPVAGLVSLRAVAVVAVQMARPAWVALIAGRLGRSPVAVWGTRAGPVGDAAHVDTGRLRKARRWALGHAALLIAQTPSMADEFRALGLGVPVTAIANPVRVPRVRPPLTGEPRVAFAGRLAEEKNLFCLLDAWKPLVEEHPQAELLIVGAGGAYRSVETSLARAARADAALARSIRFTGWVDDPTETLLGADVFVLPSLVEGMSNALLEACALGRVIVASDITSNRAVLGDEYPLLFPPTSSSALTGALRAALFDGDVRDRAVDEVTGRVRHLGPATVIAQLHSEMTTAAGLGAGK